MLRSKHRRFKASVFLGQFPAEDLQINTATGVIELVDESDVDLWQRVLGLSTVIRGKPDHEYVKDGNNILVLIPSGFDYWVDHEKVVVMSKESTLCGRCYGLLHRDEEAAVDFCFRCEMMYQKK